MYEFGTPLVLVFELKGLLERRRSEGKPPRSCWWNISEAEGRRAAKISIVHHDIMQGISFYGSPSSKGLKESIWGLKIIPIATSVMGRGEQSLTFLFMAVECPMRLWSLCKKLGTVAQQNDLERMNLHIKYNQSIYQA